MVIVVKHEQFILKNLARLDLVSKEEVCSCRDGGGRLIFDYKQKKFIFEGRCKLMLLCTFINMKKFETKLRKRGILE